MIVRIRPRRPIPRPTPLATALRPSAALTVAAVCALAAALPAGGAEFRLPLAGGDAIVMDLPSGWSGRVDPRDDSRPTAEISAADAKELRMYVTAGSPLGAAGKATPSEELRALVRAAADKARPHAVESELKLRELGAAARHGYYFSATDRKPEPGGYRHLTQGAMALDALRVTFTILVNGEPREPTAQALELLRSMRHAQPQASR